MKFFAAWFALIMILPAATSGQDYVAPDQIFLWPDGAPGAKGEEDRDKPSIRIYRPKPGTANGAAVVVCPGGAYAVLATDHEGHQIAKWFARNGVTGVVLKYRLTKRYPHPTPLQDAQRALRVVRHRAKELGISGSRIGIMGFSAGGHLASTVATHFNETKLDPNDPIDRQSSRPDFAVLGYPVVSMIPPIGHRGSAITLLGPDPTDEQLQHLSNDTQVTAETPPTFLFHTNSDKGVPAENSLQFFLALRKAGVPGEIHVYQDGPHGVGFGEGHPTLETWRDQLYGWMKSSGFLTDKARRAVTGRITLDGRDFGRGNIAFIPDDANAPTGWAMVHRGKFSIDKDNGPTTGRHRVVIRNLGSVEPHPTIDDVVVYDQGLVVEVADSGNEFHLNLTSK
jgi:acetyl esterase/lipase